MSIINNRESRWRINLFLQIVGALLLFLMVNYLGARHYRRVDWTAASVYTLSQKAQKVLATVKTPVTITVLWSRSDPYYPMLMETLRAFCANAAALKVKVLDPDEDPEQFQLLFDKVGQEATDETGQTGVAAGVVVEQGTRIRFVSSEKFKVQKSDPDNPGGVPKIEFAAEQELVGAMLEVMSGKRSNLCFTSGHKEWVLAGGGQRGLAHVRKDLTANGFDAEQLATSGGKPIPKRCDAVVVMGPAAPFQETEARALATYFQKGGRLLVLLDPIVKKGRFVRSGLGPLLKRGNIRLHDDMVVESDPRRLVSETPVTFVADRITRHQSVRHLAGTDQTPSMPVVFSIARSLERIKESPAVTDELVYTSKMAFGETDFVAMEQNGSGPVEDQGDKSGPLAIAAAASLVSPDHHRTGKMVVVGDSDFLTPALFSNAGLHNQDFWNGLLGWLTEKSALVSIAPKNPEQVQLVISQGQTKKIGLALLLQLLGIVALFIVVRRMRRR